MQYVGAGKLDKKLDKNLDDKSDKRILNLQQINDLITRLTVVPKFTENITNENIPSESSCQCNDFCEKCQDYIKTLYSESLNEIIDGYQFTK